MSDLLIVTGPPGAGKSTVSRLMAATFDRVALVPGDDFFAHIVRGAVLPWLPEADEQNSLVLRSALAASVVLAAGGCPVVYDGVLRPTSLPLVIDEAERRGLRPGQLHYALLLPPVDLCQQRVAARRGHGFTDAAATARMHADFAAGARDIPDGHVLADLPGDAASVAAVVVQQYRGGQLRWAPATR